MIPFTVLSLRASIRLAKLTGVSPDVVSNAMSYDDDPNLIDPLSDIHSASRLEQFEAGQIEGMNKAARSRLAKNVVNSDPASTAFSSESSSAVDSGTTSQSVK